MKGEAVLACLPMASSFACSSLTLLSKKSLTAVRAASVLTDMLVSVSANLQ